MTEMLYRHHITGELDERRAKKTIKAFYEMDLDDPEGMWEILITSNGGDMSAGNAIYSELASFSVNGGGNHVVTTKVRGIAASAASLVFQAGDVRLMGEMDSIMLHKPSMNISGELEYVRNMIALCDEWLERYADIYLRHSDMDRDEFMGNLEQDWTIFADTAVSYGFADGIG